MAGVMDYRGRAELALIRDLAMGEWSHRELAQATGAHPDDIRLFAQQHEDEITEVRAALAGRLAIETSGLWVTKKQNRLAEYQADIEDLERVLAVMRREYRDGADTVTLGGLGSRRHHSLIKSKLALFRQVADELEPRGAARSVPAPEEANVVHYVIEAGDHSDNLT